MRIIKLFPKTIYINTIEEDTVLDINRILGLQKTLPSSQYYVERHKDDLNRMNTTSVDKQILKNFPNLTNLIMKEFNYFKNEILKYTYNDFKITTSWLSKSVKGQSSHFHNHHNCMYSGVYYPQIDKDCGGISFEDFSDKRFVLKVESDNEYNMNEITINPKVNTVIFFPSELHHKVLLNHNANIIRYCIAFNLIPVGDLGQDDSFARLS